MLEVAAGVHAPAVAQRLALLAAGRGLRGLGLAGPDRGKHHAGQAAAEPPKRLTPRNAAGYVARQIVEPAVYQSLPACGDPPHHGMLRRGSHPARPGDRLPR